MIDMIILGFLNYCRMSGYEIKQFMAESTAHFYDASFGSLYPALKRLEQKGWVDVEESVEGGKFKKIYSIRPEGRQVFLDWLEQPVERPNTSFDFLVRIFFYGNLKPEKADELIRKFADTMEKMENEIKAVGDHIQGKADYYQVSTQRFGLDLYRFIKKWYRDFLNEKKA